jgi:hypothetical protein
MDKHLYPVLAVLTMFVAFFAIKVIEFWWDNRKQK